MQGPFCLHKTCYKENTLVSKFQILTNEVISAQVNLEHSRIAERERLFLVYAKQWWKEFLQIRASHSNRLVKIFAQDECGTNRPVCSFVCPLRAGRLLDSPRQAARFVSLLGYEHTPSVGGGRAEMWSSLHAFLCKGKGVSNGLISSKKWNLMNRFRNKKCCYLSTNNTRSVSISIFLSALF